MIRSGNQGKEVVGGVPREALRSVAEGFNMRGCLEDATLLQHGHIHETYLVTYTENRATVRYIHQRINRFVFQRPDLMMRNIARVVEHVRDKLGREQTPEPARRTLTLSYTKDGNPYYVDQEGAYWRTYLYIEGTRTYDVVRTPVLAKRAATAFAQFERMLVDVPGPRLHETIPDFHNTPKRFQRMCRVVEQDLHGRAASARAEVSFAFGRESIVHVLTEALARAELPERVVHNDTKINNVLFDALTDEAICVIDLDTVMPGLVIHDFGDLVRTSTSPGGEDERDLDRVYVRLPVFEALVRGYLEQARSFLTARELDLLPFAGKLITFEAGIRFLTDYLEGDVYFKTKRPDHNLDRARNQFQLVRSMEHQQEAMAAAVECIRRQ